jgi:hypothetical protein
MADWTGVAGAVIAAIGLGFVIMQLRGANAASRAQATIQFQAAFVRSQEARSRLQMSFPIHVSVLEQLAPQARHDDFRTWNDLDDLTAEEKRDARIVVGAMNDVAQYVVDGLALRSALQQYHTIFVKVGMLLLPYLERENASVEGRPQARFGYRIVNLYNASISYHMHHPKHRGRELALVRPAAHGEGEVRLVLLHPDGSGVSRHDGIASEPSSKGLPARYDQWKLRREVRSGERRLRR